MSYWEYNSRAYYRSGLQNRGRGNANITVPTPSTPGPPLGSSANFNSRGRYHRGRAARYVFSDRGARTTNAAASTSSTPAPPLGPLIQTLKTDDLSEPSKKFADSAAIKDVELITSFNWIDKNGLEPSILIPGNPPQWTPPTITSRLSEDDGTYFRDKNAARYPKHPIEPAVVACLAADPQLPSKTDVVACGSTLGSLLRLIRGQDKPFRMLVEKVDNAIFFIRRENSPTEIIPEVRGYGHAFPEAYTTWEPDVKGSGSHQRLISYNFGGLRFVVRFEADGYIKSANAKSSHRPAQGLGHEVASVDDLVGALSDTSIPSQAVTPSATVQVKTGGSLVDQKHVFELKTRSIYVKDTKDHLGEELPRLWVSQIPIFILAFHKSGLFESQNIQIKGVRDDVKRWENSHALELAQLAALIHRIIELVSHFTSHRLELLSHEVGMLEVREPLPDAGYALSPEVKARWGMGSLAGDSDDVEGLFVPLDEAYTFIFEDDSDKPKDYTACSASECGYCGRCQY